MKQWDKVVITNDLGEKKDAISPVIISASRATDIPAFHSKWFLNRLEKGYLVWRNPFNPKQEIYVSFRDTRLIVFWTKNPLPILPELDRIDRLGLHYYFHFTVNDYDKEGFEPNVPPVGQRIETFKRLAGRIGKEKVIWRISPFIKAEKLSMDELLERAFKTGNELAGYTDKLAFGFSDVFKYRKVPSNLKKYSRYYSDSNIHLSEFTNDEKMYLVKELAKMADSWRKVNPSFEIGACSEEMDFTPYGILPNKCVDDDLMIRLFPDDEKLMRLIGYTPGLFTREDVRNDKEKRKLKDKNQRPVCNCIISKDIGAYTTCPHDCIYCYANSSKEKVRENIKNTGINRESLI